MLPEVSPVSLIACSIGTPAETEPEKVRDQRARATFWITSPILAGNRSMNLSQTSFPPSVRFQRKKTTKAITSPGMRMNQ